MNRMQKRFQEVAQKIADCGFIVYQSKDGTHGFYTDDTGTRVVGFEFDYGCVCFHGNYQPSKHNGTGWNMGHISLNKDALRAALYAANVPSWVKRPIGPFATLEQHLERYGKSSGYNLFSGSKAAE